jgi:hypothetical protein
MGIAPSVLGDVSGAATNIAGQATQGAFGSFLGGGGAALDTSGMAAAGGITESLGPSIVAGMI